MATKAFKRSDPIKRSPLLVDYYGGVRPRGFGVQGYDDSSALSCPHCGYGYLHHGAVVVFGRSEDEPLIAETEVIGRMTRLRVMPEEQSRNPSSRRDGLSIAFWCEGCDEVSELTICQHKGQSFFGWRSADGGGDGAAAASTDDREWMIENSKGN